MKEQTIDKENVILTSELGFNFRKGAIIKKNGEEFFLEHRLKEFIKVLIENKNDVVTRSELMAYVWKDVIVNEESVTKAAHDLRKFLINIDVHDLKLVTISKLGYKLNVIESEKINPPKNSYLIRSLKLIGYALLMFLIIIILVRAARY